MNTRVYHGEIIPIQIARTLVANFNRGNLVAQQFGTPKESVVQITTKRRPLSGGTTALAISLKTVEDGVIVKVGKQAWYGVAASLGVTALTALRNPFQLLGRLDDLAQDVEYLQLVERVWEVIESFVEMTGASHQLSERLRRLSCEYCRTANPVGESTCVACGAPLGDMQPTTCSNCGFVVTTASPTCPNCKVELTS